jgi:hypothetical protein
MLLLWKSILYNSVLCLRQISILLIYLNQNEP